MLVLIVIPIALADSLRTRDESIEVLFVDGGSSDEAPPHVTASARRTAP
jgi:hypothetical protein